MDRLLNYLKIQIDLKRLNKEEVLAKFPQYEGRL